jgi:RNA polymerase sigma-70 factor, ECF subfamily
MSTFDPDAGWVPPWGGPARAPPSGRPMPEQPRKPESAQDVPRPVAITEPELAAAPVAGQLPRRWFDEHFDSLWRLVARLGVPRHSVDDVVQEVFITASRRHADIRAGQERRFLIGTAVRVSANYRTRACVRHEVAQGDWLEHACSATPSAEQLLIEKRQREQLEQALEHLPEQQRSVFVLYELEGFSVAEIADLLALPSGTAASRLGRARARFSEVVARWSLDTAAANKAAVEEST